MTSGTIGVLLEDLIATAHRHRLPQYEVFRLFPQGCSVVSFNWDGLAHARCPQSPVIHPHGALRPRSLLGLDLDELLDYSQLDDCGTSRAWVLPGLVMPGEELASELSTTRERVFTLWREATSVIIIGYSFGSGSAFDYDRVWLDVFAEVMAVNAQAAIHVLDPEADRIRGDLVERIRRSVNVYAWCVSWRSLATALLSVAREARAADITGAGGTGSPRVSRKARPSLVP